MSEKLHADIQEWAARTLSARSRDDWYETTGRSVTIDASEYPAIVVDDPIPPPHDARLVIKNPGGASATYQVVSLNGHSPDEIVIATLSNLTNLVLDNRESRFRNVTVNTSGEDGRGPNLSVGTGGGQSPETLRLVGENISLDMPSTPQHLLLENARLSNNTGWQDMERLSLTGFVGIPIPITTRNLTLPSGGCELETDEITALHISGPEGTILQIVSGTVRTLRMDSGILVYLAAPTNSSIHIGDRIGMPDGTLLGPGENERLEFAGSGDIHVGGSLSDAVFMPGYGGLRLKLYGTLVNARGTVELSISPRAFASGDPNEGLAVSTISVEEGADLQNISLYGLKSVGDLAELRKAERFSPWLPSQSEASERADRMGLGGGDPDTMAQKRRHFFAKLSLILSETHAPGSVQSMVRFEAARLRRASLRKWSKEWVLLSFYGCVRYGEGILRPLVIHGALTFLASLYLFNGSLVKATVGEVLGTWSDVALLPILFLARKTPPSLAKGGLEEAVELGIAVVGGLLIFFAASAIRRITKAE